MNTPTNADPERPRCTQHWGDCTYYASLVNRRPTDGICTCGYGWTVFADSGGTDYSQLYSDERRALPTPMAATQAQEPPWYSLLCYLHEQFPATLGHLPLATRIESACRAYAEAHAAALAQERDRARAFLDDAAKQLDRVVSERETLRATVAHLTAERDKAIAALRSLATERDGALCWCTTPVCVNQPGCEAARAALGLWQKDGEA